MYAHVENQCTARAPRGAPRAPRFYLPHSLFRHVMWCARGAGNRPAGCARPTRSTSRGMQRCIPRGGGGHRQPEHSPPQAPPTQPTHWGRASFRESRAPRPKFASGDWGGTRCVCGWGMGGGVPSLCVGRGWGGGRRVCGQGMGGYPACVWVGDGGGYPACVWVGDGGGTRCWGGLPTHEPK